MRTVSRRFVSIALLSLFAILIACPRGQAKDYWTKETKAERDARMAWWRDARFGMFIHWGLYAIPAGEWKGKTDHAEWIRTTAQIPLETYNEFVGQFNPVKFNADEWVRQAKRAGMRYIVITSKHHDGFCLWPSDQTQYDVASTPFKRDILKELTEACRKHGVRMCFYHSIMDWHHPDYLPRRAWEKDRSSEGADYGRYVNYMKLQLKELVTNYDPGVLWFDGEWEGSWTHEHGKDLYQYVRELSPDIIINNRVDKGRRGMHGLTREGEFRGDFGTPEQQIPAEGLPGVDWESCMTMNGHWGWNRNDKNWKSTQDLIRKLADIASKGGNFLLNIGPKADGTFPEESVERLEAIGKWMDINEEAIYETDASPTAQPPWGRITRKALDGDTTRLYLHVFDWPSDGRLGVAVMNKVKACYLLAEPSRTFNATSDPSGTSVKLTGDAPDPICSVVVLDIVGAPEVAAPVARQQSDGTVQLTASDADIKNPDGGDKARVETKNGKPNIGYWLDASCRVEWNLLLDKADKYELVADVACIDAGSGFEVVVGEAKLSAMAPDTGAYEKFQTVSLGTLKLKEGSQKLSVIPDKKTWKPINLSSITLTPVK